MYPISFFLLFQFGVLALNFFDGLMGQCNYAVPYFKDEYLVLDTLNGQIKGSCEPILINDTTTKSQIVDFIISWKSFFKIYLKNKNIILCSYFKRCSIRRVSNKRK